MDEIKCPNCGTVFQISESNYDSIVKQIKNEEFNKELKIRESILLKEHENKINNLKVESELKIKELEFQINNIKLKEELNVKNAITDKEKEILELKNHIDNNNMEYILKEKSLTEKYEEKLKAKEEQIAYYKDFKAKQSTKMIGESLEQHCNIEFNRLRGIFGKNTYFEKDNDSKYGSKGDFIFRDYDENGIEIVSIMFEMKNEADETSTKHKNEDFFKELDKDRKQKNCEYAVLVSLLEIDNELYNTGIVDVSHKYQKMYVIRPQFFIPLITLIRNISLNSLEYKKMLIEKENQNIDIANFENNILEFKNSFSKNYIRASEKFQKAIEEIDKSIIHLNKIKEALISSENQLKIANNKAEDLSIKKLTRNNETMKKLFSNLNNE